MKKLKITLIWLLGILITLAAAKYQRATGPTHPYQQSFLLNDTLYELELIRSGIITEDAVLELNIPDESINAQLHYRQYPTKDDFVIVEFERDGGALVANLPKQPMAGKLEYKVTISDASGKVQSTPFQIIRFKGEVPMAVLIPHVLLMFFTMLLSNVAGLFAVFRFGQYKLVSKLTLLLLLLGGMILGPLVQKYAFNEFWAGVPFGWDLTDNKTLIAFVFWIIAFFMLNKKSGRTWTIVAALVTLVIFAIPHSMFGSELDPETGEIIQGSVFLLLGVSFRRKKNTKTP